MTQESAPNRISLGADGLGEVSDAQIEKRATELARTEARDAVTDADRERARLELTNLPGEPVAPEAGAAEVEQLVAFDEPVDATGHRADRGALEEDANIGEQLVQEGLDEAEHDSRVSAIEEPEDS